MVWAFPQREEVPEAQKPRSEVNDTHMDENNSGMISVEEVVLVKTGLPRWQVALYVSEGSHAGAGVASRSDLDHWRPGTRLCWESGATKTQVPQGRTACERVKRACGAGGKPRDRHAQTQRNEVTDVTGEGWHRRNPQGRGCHSGRQCRGS